MFGNSSLAGLLLIGAVLAPGAGTASAQEYPSRPIRFIVPTTSGATADLVARVVGTEMSKVLGQPIVIEDRPGANQIIGLEHVAKQSPADGYTVGIVGVDGVALLPLTTRDLRFDPMKDLVPIAGLAEARYVLAGPAARPWKTFNELVTHARANPGKLNYGSSVNQVRFPVMLILQELGLDMVHIPYSGGRPYDQAIVGGTLDLGILTEGSASRLGDKVRVFASTGQQRIAAQPDVPTFAELNFPQIKGPTYSLSVRTGTPKAITDKLASATSTTLERPEVKVAMERLLLKITNEKSDVAARNLVETAQFYADFIRKANIKPE